MAGIKKSDFNSLNEHQKKAFMNILGAARFHIGGLENTVADNGPETEYGRIAREQLADHEGLCFDIYCMAISDIYPKDGGVIFGTGAAKEMKNIRFCGEDWLKERVERRVRKMGY